MTSIIETCFNARLIVYTQVFGVFLQSSVTVNSIHNKILDCAPVCHIDAPSCGCPITGMQYQQYVGYLMLDTWSCIFAIHRFIMQVLMASFLMCHTVFTTHENTTE